MARLKRADSLAKDYELGTEAVDFYNYIVDSLINGQRQQVRNLFNKMHKDDKQNFLVNFLEDDNGYHTSTKKICIVELTS